MTSPDEWKIETTKVPLEPEPSLNQPPPPFRVETHSIDFFGANYGARMALIEAHAAAFLQYTKLAPSDCELVETRDRGETRWYFRRRG